MVHLVVFHTNRNHFCSFPIFCVICVLHFTGFFRRTDIVCVSNMGKINKIDINLYMFDAGVALGRTTALCALCLIILYDLTKQKIGINSLRSNEATWQMDTTLVLHNFYGIHATSHRLFRLVHSAYCIHTHTHISHTPTIGPSKLFNEIPRTCSHSLRFGFCRSFRFDFCFSAWEIVTAETR